MNNDGRARVQQGRVPAAPGFRLSPAGANSVGVLLVAAALAALALSAHPASAASCSPVINPYEGTRYEGIDLTRIRAEDVGCSKARRAAKRAHKKALGLTPDASGYLSFRWNGWDVFGNLRPDHDRYRATRRDHRVRWRF